MARLPKELLRPFGGGVTLEVQLIENGLRYPRDMPDAITRRRRYRRSA
jgi:hypothetical protein